MNLDSFNEEHNDDFYFIVYALQSKINKKIEKKIKIDRSSKKRLFLEIGTC